MSLISSLAKHLRINGRARDRAALGKLERTLDCLGLKLQPHVAGRRMAALGKTIKARNEIVRRALTTKFGGHHG